MKHRYIMLTSIVNNVINHQVVIKDNTDLTNYRFSGNFGGSELLAYVENLPKLPFDEVKKFVESQKRVSSISEWSKINSILKQESSDHLLLKTGWTINEFIEQEIKNTLELNDERTN